MNNLKLGIFAIILLTCKTSQYIIVKNRFNFTPKTKTMK